MQNKEKIQLGLAVKWQTRAAIDIPKSSTRREDLLLDRDEQEAVYIMRRALNGLKADEAVENILNLFTRTRDNREFVQIVKKQKFI